MTYRHIKYFIILISYLKNVYTNHRQKRISHEKDEIVQQQVIKDYRLLEWDDENLTEEYLEMGIHYQKW